MTLILFAKCNEGFLLIADKQGSVDGGEKLSVQKIFSPKSRKYILALAGDGNRIEQIYSMLKTLNIEKKEIELGKKDSGISDTEIETIVMKEIKKRTEAYTQYKKGERDDLAQSEKEESEVLERYAPEQMEASELESLVEAAIKETGATGPADTGSVMKEVMAKAQGKADGGKVAQLVREKLNSN